MTFANLYQKIKNLCLTIENRFKHANLLKADFEINETFRNRPS